MLIGYARTSTVEQQAGFESQLVELNTYGCERVYKEQVSAVATRNQLEAAIDMLREGPLCQGSCLLLYLSLIFRWAG